MQKEKRNITSAFMFTTTLAAILLLAPSFTRAQEQTAKQSAATAAGAVKDETTAAEGTKPAEEAKTEEVKQAVAPVFDDYKGVKIGMSAGEARQLLGNPKEEGKEQDFFAFSDSETAQVFYDGAGKVTAVAVSFYGGKGNAPGPSAVLGRNIEAKADGSLYQREPYPEAGYWVSYSRTAGDSPVVTITIQKML